MVMAQSRKLQEDLVNEKAAAAAAADALETASQASRRSTSKGGSRGSKKSGGELYARRLFCSRGAWRGWSRVLSVLCYLAAHSLFSFPAKIHTHVRTVFNG